MAGMDNRAGIDGGRERRVFSISIEQSRGKCPLCGATVWVSGLRNHLATKHHRNKPKVLSVRVEVTVDD